MQQLGWDGWNCWEQQDGRRRSAPRPGPINPLVFFFFGSCNGNTVRRDTWIFDRFDSGEKRNCSGNSWPKQNSQNLSWFWRNSAVFTPTADARVRDQHVGRSIQGALDGAARTLTSISSVDVKRTATLTIPKYSQETTQSGQSWSCKPSISPLPPRNMESNPRTEKHTSTPRASSGHGSRPSVRRGPRGATLTASGS